MSKPMNLGTLPPIERDNHDPVRLEQRAVVDEDTKRVTGYVQGARVLKRSVVERLYFADHISRQQLIAARTLYSAFYRGGLSPVVTLSLTKVHTKGGPGHGLSENQLEARDEYNAAMRAIPGEVTDLIFDVVCADLSLAQIAFSRGWGKTTKALALLRVGLDDLARHYDQKKTS